MVREINLSDTPLLIKYRIDLLRSTNQMLNDAEMNEYSKALETFFEKNIPDKRLIGYIYEDNNVPRGYCLMCFYNIIPLLKNPEGKIALLTDMYVEEEHRHHGIGTQLLNAVMSSAKALGYPKVILNASDEGLGLYEKYGFRTVENEMAFKFQTTDAISIRMK